MKDNKIDNLIKEWDQQLKPVFKDKEKLKQAVFAEISQPQSQGLKGKGGYFIIPKPVVYIGSIAAALVVSFVAVFTMLSVKHVKEKAATTPLMALTDEHMNEMKMVKSEVDHLFPEGVAWVFKCKNSMEIFPADTPEEKNGKKLLIHHVVLKKIGRTWRKVYMADIMTRQGEPVMYEKNGESKAYLWTHKLDSNKFALEGQLKIKANGTTLDLEFIGGQEVGRSYLLKTVKQGKDEYRVYQTIKEI